MKATRNEMVMCAALVLTWLAGPNLAEEPKVPQNPEELAKAMAEAGAPGPEHAKLQKLAGSWTYVSKFWMDPNSPPVETKGTVERKPVLGGRFLEEKYVGTNFDGKPGFEGLSLLGYDNGRKKYTSSWVSSMCTSTCTGLGAADSAGTKFTFQTEAFCPMQKKLVKGREEIRIEGNDKVVVESYLIEDGKETKVMELVSLRKK